MPFQKVSISKPFFNPTVGQKIRIDLELARAGSLTVLIVDRDGYPVRKLVSGGAVQAGRVGYDWDGRDDRGEIVPDEAYSLKMNLDSGGQASEYFPGNTPGNAVDPTTNYYDKHGAVLSYRLPKPCRVHIQAGVAKRDAKTGKSEGPVLKTLVNREPRPAGAVVENWNGFDEGGTFYIPDLPNFVVSIAATSLPDNSIIAYGNKKTRFLDSVASREGASLFTFSVTGHAHHQGLASLDDAAPRMKTALQDATWSGTDRVWRTSRSDLEFSVSIEGPSAPAFGNQPARLKVFLDGALVQEIDSPTSGMRVRVKSPKGASGVHVVAVNWASQFGPVAVDAFRVEWSGGNPSRVASAASGQ